VPADTAVLVTARNEAERIAETLAALRAAFPGARVVVGDDASADSTPDIARAEGAELVRVPRRLGKGGAATAGARAALEARPALVVLCDGDLGPSARHLPRLADAVSSGDADLAVAAFARPLGGGLGLALEGARRAIEVATGERPRAPLSGQRAMRRELLEELLPFAAGFGMETAMTIDALRGGHRLVEVELPLEHRATGRTPAGFLHRARQLRDIRAAARSRSGG
jgi:glycosyltransferase involved in cell wall biosynthesis